MALSQLRILIVEASDDASDGRGYYNPQLARY